ncbi:MAG TPA: hypothetical protein VI935_01925 [Thermodesulfobacteriota bacterium]|nr:hypothetical protein [Thermodesulfobacteriota bacterium]
MKYKVFSFLFSHSFLVRIEYSQYIIDAYMDFKIHDPSPVSQLPPGFAIDDTQPQRQRTQEGALQKEHYSGKVIYLWPTAAGRSTTRRQPRRLRSPICSTPRL